jgi:small subunit ribosomal protein S17
MSEETATISTDSADKSRGMRKSRVGTVISKSGEKTIVVETVIRVPHPRFKKIIKRSSKFHAHDEENKAVEGDKVRIVETRPLSKMKRWRLVEILKH